MSGVNHRPLGLTVAIVTLALDQLIKYTVTYPLALQSRADEGIDLLPTEPLDGVTILEMDFMADEAPETIMGHLGGPPDLVMSDMAANTVGHKQTDHLRTMGLVETAADFAIQTLAPGGQFLAKVLAGGTDAQLLALLKKNFKTVKHAKPPASRAQSAETYLVALGFRG